MAQKLPSIYSNTAPHSSRSAANFHVNVTLKMMQMASYRWQRLVVPDSRLIYSIITIRLTLFHKESSHLSHILHILKLFYVLGLLFLTYVKTYLAIYSILF